MTDDDVKQLRKWIDAITASKLGPLLKQQLIPIHMRGHASPTAGAKRNQDLSTTRRSKVEGYLKTMVGFPIRVEYKDRGDAESGPITPKPKDPNKAYAPYRNAALYIDVDEARAALQNTSTGAATNN
jgi:hypothetical protein